MSITHKIQRTANAPAGPPSELETKLAQSLVELENNVPEIKAELRPLQISAAKEVDVKGGKKAIVVFVPVPQLKAYRKVHARCVFMVHVLNAISPSRLLLIPFSVLLTSLRID